MLRERENQKQAGGDRKSLSSKSSKADEAHESVDVKNVRSGIGVFGENNGASQ
jgi:hypothetical protein